MAEKASADPRACRAVLPGARECTRKAQPGFPYCSAHAGPLRTRLPSSPSEFFGEWAATAEGFLAARLKGEQPEPGAYDPLLVDTLLPLALPLYYWYWRVDVEGVENVPAEGSAILAANHSGTLPIDGAMLKIAVVHEHGRNPWLLAADLAFKLPGFATLLRRAGNARADREETVDLLNKGEIIGVFPEGFKGIGKGWAKRYQLQRFGRGGFVEVAMETGAPIVPTAIVGAEEAYPMIANLRGLAKRLGLPYFPVTPTFPLLGPLGAIPLPSKWMLVFGEPIPMSGYGPEAVEDTQTVLEISEEVRQRVQDLIAGALARRRRAFF